MRKPRRVPHVLSVRRSVNAVFGTLRFANVVLATMLVMSLSWFTDAMLTPLLEWVAGPIEIAGITTPELYVGYGIALLAFPMLVGFTWLRLRAEIMEQEPFIDDDAPAGPKRALILFLSPPGADLPAVDSEDVATPGTPGWLHDASAAAGLSLASTEDRARFTRAWRMPVEAVAFHASRLESISVIPSADHAASGTTGTWSVANMFADVIRCMWTESRPAPEIDISDPVDFDSADAVLRQVNDIYRRLSRLYRNREIIIDVTGGLKTCTFAGATAALSEGRLVQYVDGRDYRVRFYDIRFAATEPEH